MAKVAKSTKKFLAKKQKQKGSNTKSAQNQAPSHLKKKRKTTAHQEKVPDLASGLDDAGLNVREEEENDPFMDDSDYEDPESSQNDDSDVDDALSDTEDIENLEFDEESDDEMMESDVESQSSELDSNEIERHKKQLEALQKQDPEFYEFLAKNDKKLLEFGDNEEDDDDDEEDQEIDQDETPEPSQPQKSRQPQVLNLKTITSWKHSLLKQHSQRTIQRVLLAFRAAVALGKEQDNNDTQSFAYKIDDANVFNALVLTFIKHVPTAFNKHLLPSKSLTTKTQPTQSPKWKKLSPLVKSFVSNLLSFLKQMTDTSMIRFILQKSEPVIPYITSFPKLGKEYLKLLIKFWGGLDHTISVVSFLNIRKLSVWAPKPYLDMCIKGLYVKYISVARGSSQLDPTYISFMASCITELCVLNPTVTYQHAFGYIRQLAIHLRNALTGGSKDGFKVVYNWQYLWCLRVWVKVLSFEGGEGMSEELAPLVYPLVQVALGALRLKPSAKYFPFRFQVIKLLNELMAKTGTFIPVASHIFEVLESHEMRSTPKPSTLPSFPLTTSIKTPNAYLSTRPFHTSIIEEIATQLYEFYAALSTNISFPELALPGIMVMKRYCKRSKFVSVNKVLLGVVEKLEQNSRWVEGKRAGVEFSPRDVGRVKEFTASLNPLDSPLGKYVASRRKLTERQQKTMQSSTSSSTPSSSFANSTHDLKQSEKRKRGEEFEDSESDDENMGFAGSDDDGDEQFGFGGMEEKGVKKEPKKMISKELEKEIKMQVEGLKKTQKSKKVDKKNSKGKKVELVGDEDLVEDFVLSDDE
ncbi:Nucleolar Complex 2 protein [Nowakowskiella sp. JEL0407]|nr:Nucleolar Complex 2 protein [Nowakowskiella sp. JEL0407]